MSRARDETGGLVEDARADPTVSSPDEELILVDPDDGEIGYASKVACHDGQGLLHRAFSIFIFNERGEILLQRRSRHKRLWPEFWTNSCCSHPRRGERMEDATRRRLAEELGLACDLRFAFKFEYQAVYGDVGAEHELCSVFVGTTSAPVRGNANEMDAWRFITPAELDEEIARYGERFTPWIKLEWPRLRG